MKPKRIIFLSPGITQLELIYCGECGDEWEVLNSGVALVLVGMIQFAGPVA